MYLLLHNDQYLHGGARGIALVLLMTCAWIKAEEKDAVPALNERFAARLAEGPFETPNFQRHVIPLLGRLGCNGRSCHGSFQGRGGFRLSMFGYDFAEDHRQLLAGDPPRANPQDPSGSLILLKPTNADEHEGGKRYDPEGWEYRVLRAWITQGAKDDSNLAGQLKQIQVSPVEVAFQQPGMEVPLRVIATWSDGTREDVTCLTRFHTNDESVAHVTVAGMVKAIGPGDSYIIAMYDNAVVAVPVLMPIANAPVKTGSPTRLPTKIDEYIAAKLHKLGIEPAELCIDEEFLRRVSLDISGTLPTPQQVRDFIADASPDKRERKINELLETPAYAKWWSTRFCDITGLNGPLQLGTTDFGPIMTEHWRSWLERKVRDNVPYDKIVEGMVVAVSRRSDQSYKDYALQMSAYVRTKDPVDFTERETMPNFWFRGNLRTAEEKALAFAYTFMGVRLDCAQCHKHPFDRWSQQDFQQFAAVFEPIRWGVSPQCEADYNELRTQLGVPEKLNTAAIRRQTYWRWAAEGKLVPWPEVFIAQRSDSSLDKNSRTPAQKDGHENLRPKLLGDAEIDLSKVDDPRRQLMDWLRKPDNPYFAQAFVNRVWAHYFGRGIVEPADDLNLGNPPTNPELFDGLAASFVEHGYDIKWLHREITRSHAYQRSWKTNATNRTDERNFSRAIIRRLPAEVAVDAMRMATASTKVSEGFAMTMKDRRIGIQATADLSRTEFSLAVFGKPLRNINCDCEREQNPSLAQAIFLRNDQDLHALIDRKDGWIEEFRGNERLAEPAHRDELIRLAYLRTLSREPVDQELSRARKHVNSADDPLDGLRDLLWALLNTQEFITNH